MYKFLVNIFYSILFTASIQNFVLANENLGLNDENDPDRVSFHVQSNQPYPLEIIISHPTEKNITTTLKASDMTTPTCASFAISPTLLSGTTLMVTLLGEQLYKGSIFPDGTLKVNAHRAFWPKSKIENTLPDGQK